MTAMVNFGGDGASLLQPAEGFSVSLSLVAKRTPSFLLLHKELFNYINNKVLYKNEPNQLKRALHLEGINE